MTLNAVDPLAIKNYLKQDDILNPEIKPMIYRIVFLSTEAKDKVCYAHNAYFAKEFGKSERTIRRWIKILQDLGYITIKIVRKGKYIIGRTIQIAQSLLEKTVNFLKNKAKKSEAEKSYSKANGQPYGLSSRISKDIKRKDILYKYNISTRENKNQRPKNYDKVLEFWTDKNLEGTARAFWKYNTKRAWANIRNWKQAAIGWARKAKDNLAAFKANKTKHKQTTTDYENILNYVSYNTWDML